MRTVILLLCAFWGVGNAFASSSIFNCNFKDESTVKMWKPWFGGAGRPAASPSIPGGGAIRLWGTSSAYFDFNRFPRHANGVVKFHATISCNFKPAGDGRAMIGLLNPGSTTWQAGLFITENGTIGLQNGDKKIYANNYKIADMTTYHITMEVNYPDSTAKVSIYPHNTKNVTHLEFQGEESVALSISPGYAFASRAAASATAGCELFVDSIMLVDDTAPGGSRMIDGGTTFRLPQERIITPRVGLCIHDCYTMKEVNVLAESGVDMVRWHFTWQRTMKDGKFQMKEGGYDYIRGIIANRMEPLMILAYSHTDFDTPGKRPDFGQFINQNERWYKGWGSYCAWMAKTFGSRGTGQVKFWEIWNEQNAGPAEQYMKVLSTAVENIKREDPNAVIVFGGISRMDMEFTEKCMKLGVGKLIDAFAFHPYRESTFPENGFQLERRFKGKAVSCYADEVNELRELIERYTPKDKHIPLWITETGYCTQDSEKQLNPALYIDHDVKAKYMLRNLVQNFALGIETVVIYRATHSSFFGLTYGAKFRPRSGYFALQDFCQIFPQKQNVKVLPWKIAATPKLNDLHAYAFHVDPENVLLFIWNAGIAESCIQRVTIQERNPKYSITLPAVLKIGTPTECTDIFLSETINVTPKVLSDGTTLIENLPIYDSPLVLKLQLKEPADFEKTK